MTLRSFTTPQRDVFPVAHNSTGGPAIFARPSVASHFGSRTPASVGILMYLRTRSERIPLPRRVIGRCHGPEILVQPDYRSELHLRPSDRGVLPSLASVEAQHG